METSAIKQSELDNCAAYLNALNGLINTKDNIGKITSKSILSWAVIHNSDPSVFKEALTLGYFIMTERDLYRSTVNQFEPFHARKCLLNLYNTPSKPEAHQQRENGDITKRLTALEEENLYLRYKDSKYGLDPLIYQEHSGHFSTNLYNGELGYKEAFICHSICTIDAITFIETINNKYADKAPSLSQVRKEFQVFIGRKWEALQSLVDARTSIR